MTRIRSLPAGLYETLVTEEVVQQLEGLATELRAIRGNLHPAEAGDRLGLHLNRVLLRVFEQIPEASRVEQGIRLARQILAWIEREVEGAGTLGDCPLPSEPVLRGIARTLPDGTPEELLGPLTPLLDTTLLTNAKSEPRIGAQLLSELASADRVDVTMAFIRTSGIRPLLPALRRLRGHGRPLRILTTTYTGSTEQAALDLLQELGAQIRVSYDTSGTRLHAKAWHFHRESGFSTVYIGSSNLTHSAQVTGLEWNVRVSGARNPDVIRKVEAVFESYWQRDEFIPYDPIFFQAQMDRARAGRQGTPFLTSPIELRLEPFQERLLEQVAIQRQRGHHRNLLVSATGTGKTVMAAIDYKLLRASLKTARLLFVAHRREILEASLATFRHAFRDPGFGELWVGGKRPGHFQHVFASIQNLGQERLSNLEPEHFDVVIVDEFHHAAAPSYRALLDHVRPQELLGLTATPERSDGLALLDYFGGRIAAELRLWDAIDQGRLAPFQYFGVHDPIDLTQIPWKRGRGYDVDALTGLLTANDIWARRVLENYQERCENWRTARTLAFCVSVSHAQFMARYFREHQVAAAAVSGETPPDQRDQALRDLANGTLQVLFSVDLFNEGVDLPQVDTLLMLRPTDSPVLFLQQLGRGLRKSPGKSACTVLDFVGHHHREYRMDRRYRALLGGTRRTLQAAVEEGFPFLPAGCHLELDPLARESVLRSIRLATPSGWARKIEEFRSVTEARGKIRLAGFLDESGLDLEEVYSGTLGWSDLQEAGGAAILPRGKEETSLRRACGRMLHLDDRERLDSYRGFLTGKLPASGPGVPERQQRLARMLVTALTGAALPKGADLDHGIEMSRAHPQVVDELLQLFEVLAARVGHLQHPLAGFPEVPLHIHARYTRAEILAAFGVGGEAAKVANWQSGVYWVPKSRADLCAFTLDKTSGNFSPTTSYRDYAISRELIHWESQNSVRDDSETGLRYQEHAARGTSIMLFAREVSSHKDFWFLGPASYVSHKGERPMAITWRLEIPLPGDLYAAFAAAVA